MADEGWYCEVCVAMRPTAERLSVAAHDRKICDSCGVELGPEDAQRLRLVARPDEPVARVLKPPLASCICANCTAGRQAFGIFAVWSLDKLLLLSSVAVGVSRASVRAVPTASPGRPALP